MKKNYVLVTGASGGLGNAFVQELSNQNKNLIICGTNIEKLNELKNKIKNNKISILPYAFDLSNEQEIYRLVEFIKSQNINIEMLINNAGFITEGSIQFARAENLIQTIKVNNIGTILLTKLLLEQNAYKDLSIITVSSLASNYPMPYMAIYSATKSLLTSFFYSLKSELKQNNVKVLIVEPGAIPTSQDMINAIKAQGIKGKLSSVSAKVIAKNSLKKSAKNKKIYTPGFLNKLTKFVCKFTPKSLQIYSISKMWKKSQQKRGIR